MTVLAQTGAFGWGIQTAKGTLATVWYRHKANDINFGTQQDLRTFPLEVGGGITPTGAYKGGAFIAGGATFQPRLEDQLGWMIKALMGAVATTPDTPEVGVNEHIFKFATDVSSLPWISVRKLVPGTAKLGEIGKDCKVTTMRFNFPQNGILQARMDAVGREPTLAETAAVDAWTWFAANEDYVSVPITCTTDAFVKVPASGSALPVVNLSVTMANNLTSPQQEMIIGSPYPDDFVPVSRAATIQATVKWADPDLYQQIVTGSAGGTAWSATPYVTDFQAKVTSPGVIGATATKYTLIIDAERVMWSAGGPPVLAGGEMVMMPLVGTVIEPTSGEYLTFTVLNEAATY